MQNMPWLLNLLSGKEGYSIASQPYLSDGTLHYSSKFHSTPYHTFLYGGVCWLYKHTCTGYVCNSLRFSYTYYWELQYTDKFIILETLLSEKKIDDEHGRKRHKSQELWKSDMLRTTLWPTSVSHHSGWLTVSSTRYYTTAFSITSQHKPGNVRKTQTLRRVRATTVAVEKQVVWHILTMCL
jgi:hypothetical protein